MSVHNLQSERFSLRVGRAYSIGVTTEWAVCSVCDIRGPLERHETPPLLFRQLTVSVRVPDTFGVFLIDEMNALGLATKWSRLSYQSAFRSACFVSSSQTQNRFASRNFSRAANPQMVIQSGMIWRFDNCADYDGVHLEQPGRHNSHPPDWYQPG